MPPATVSLRVERQLLAGGALLVCGVDEVGRGALGGPVSVGMVVVDSTVRRSLPGVRDSKLLTPRARTELVPRIRPMGGGVRGRARLGRRDRRGRHHRGPATGGDAGAGGAAGRAGCRPPRRQARLAHAAAAGLALRRSGGRSRCLRSRCGSRPTSPAPRSPRPASWPRSSGTRSWPIWARAIPGTAGRGTRGTPAPTTLRPSRSTARASSTGAAGASRAIGLEPTASAGLRAKRSRGRGNLGGVDEGDQGPR